MNKKGFTLIELLAVVVILGLVIGIAIPSVTSTITNSRKKTFIESANSYIVATEELMSLNGGKLMPQSGTSRLIRISELEISSNTKKDSSGNIVDAFGSSLIDKYSFVIVEASPVDKVFSYNITLLDRKGNFIRNVKKEDLDVSSIEFISYNSADETNVNNVINEIKGSYDNLKEYATVLKAGEMGVRKYDVNGDGLVNNRDYQICTFIRDGKYEPSEAEKLVMGPNIDEACRTINACIITKNEYSADYRELCNRYSESDKVTIDSSIEGAGKFASVYSISDPPNG